MTSYWIGVASREHVMEGVRNGICQLGHGKKAPVSRLQRDDVILYYAPRERLGEGEPVQAFVAAGRIVDDAPYQVDAGNGFKPYRRNTKFWPTHDAPIKPLLKQLSFTRDRDNWGIIFRRSAFAITAADYRLVAHAMGIEGS